MTGLAEALSAGQSAAIYDVCLKTMGNVGVALAMNRRGHLPHHLW